ncbi:polysaccharide biosynthesis domain protein [Leptospira borgpetersenii serovar Pomona str. 200901868]|uniref:Polysaccharide biosynthesis domain protein n=1 Tax=Leptospira borgpetersenii serovar Pomona str. 200901868 TaxID=1192866 RepID=M6W3G7_LEPBO|nr:polysaccharide biosynthesis domain protein [Leptospira borgpetersenii serovar Pomona str. 200901868]
MKKILVTGGAGFIGSNFVNLILNENEEYQIIVFDKLTYAGNLKSLEYWKRDPRFIFIKADIANKENVSSIFQEHNFDYVAHFAAESHVDRSILGPEEFIKTNVLGTFYLLDAARLQWNGSYEGKNSFTYPQTKYSER